MSQFDAFARYYDADYGAIDEDLLFYRELAQRTDGPVLEVMCGSGRLLLPLARAGLRLTGVDVSSTMIGLARERLAAAGLSERVRLLQADIRQRAPHGPFGLAIVAINSFMHLANTDEQLAALEHIHAALRPGGLLAIDLFNPEPRTLSEQHGALVLDKSFTLADGTRVQKFVAQHVDMAAQTSHVTFIYDELDAEGQIRRSALPFTMRWLYRYELEHLLVRAGFALDGVYGSYDLDDYSTESELLLVVARKSDD
jgi:SAM-dependent methyltransferase